MALVPSPSGRYLARSAESNKPKPDGRPEPRNRLGIAAAFCYQFGPLAYCGTAQGWDEPVIWKRFARALSQISTARWMVLAALALAFACFLWGERVPVIGSLGWDRATYARWAQNFHEEIFVNDVDDYYVKHILPSAVVHYSMRALAIPRIDYNVLHAFGLLDVCLITALAWLWGRPLGGRAGDCPVTEAVSDRLLRLPLFFDLSEADQSRVIEATRAFCAGIRAAA